MESKRLGWMLLAACLALAGCDDRSAEGVAAGGEAMNDELAARAAELARRLMIVDTHIDLPWRLSESPEDVTVRTAGGDFDYVRAREGGLDLPFMSIYVPAEYQESGGARRLADELIDMVEALSVDHPDKFAMVAAPARARAVFAEGKLGLALGIENGAAIEDDLANLEHFHRRGVRYVTLAHSKANRICDSSYDEERPWGGLSPFGRRVVEEMNRLGLMIDVSHVSDAAFHQIVELSRAPVIASHSSCRRFTPGWERNIGDDMIRRVGEQGGVVQINFGSAFLRDDARKQSEAFWAARGEFVDEHGLNRDDPAVESWIADYWKERRKIYADVSEVADHIDHVVGLIGVDHVGLGSDFDGVGDSLPTGLKDVSQYPNLIAVLLQRGYDDEQIEKICSGNVLRVWSEVERVAAEPSR